jgi:hypothetical protein
MSRAVYIGLLAASVGTGAGCVRARHRAAPVASNRAEAPATLVFQELTVGEGLRPNERVRYELTLDRSHVVVVATQDLDEQSTPLDVADASARWTRVTSVTVHGTTRKEGETLAIEFPTAADPSTYACEWKEVDVAPVGSSLGHPQKLDCDDRAKPARVATSKQRALSCHLSVSKHGVGIELDSRKRGSHGGWLVLGSPGIEYIMGHTDCDPAPYGFRRLAP